MFHLRSLDSVRRFSYAYAYVMCEHSYAYAYVYVCAYVTSVNQPFHLNGQTSELRPRT